MSAVSSVCADLYNTYYAIVHPSRDIHRLIEGAYSNNKKKRRVARKRIKAVIPIFTELSRHDQYELYDARKIVAELDFNNLTICVAKSERLRDRIRFDNRKRDGQLRMYGCFGVYPKWSCRIRMDGRGGYIAVLKISCLPHKKHLRLRAA